MILFRKIFYHLLCMWLYGNFIHIYMPVPTAHTHTHPKKKNPAPAEVCAATKTYSPRSSRATA